MKHSVSFKEALDPLLHVLEILAMLFVSLSRTSFSHPTTCLSLKSSRGLNLFSLNILDILKLTRTGE